MISREDVAKVMWRAVSNRALAPTPPLTEEEWEPVWRDRLTPGEREVWRTAADAILALIPSEVPVQRDERAEKLGERLDAMVADCTANHRIISRLEERVRELDAAWLRHTWPCGHISEGTGDEPDRCRICVAEERVRKAEGERDTWKDCIAEEMAENIKLFNLLGVMPEIEAGRASTDAVVDAVRKLKAELAATQATLASARKALKDIRGLLVVRPHRFADQSEKIHAVLDSALAEERKK